MDPENPIDLGYLLECMLFYKTVTVVADRSILKQLLVSFGPEYFELLLTKGTLKVNYSNELLGIHTQTLGSYQFHTPLFMGIPKFDLQHELPELTVKLLGKSGRGRKLARRLQNLISTEKRDPNLLEALNQ